MNWEQWYKRQKGGIRNFGILFLQSICTTCAMVLYYFRVDLDSFKVHTENTKTISEESKKRKYD